MGILGHKKHISYGSMRARKFDKGLVLLYVRDKNPVALAMDYCDSQGYNWLSLPESLSKLGAKRLIEFVNEECDVHFQKQAGRGYVMPTEERVTSELAFNTYTMVDELADLTGNVAPLEERIKVYCGHNLPFSHDELVNGYDESLAFKVTDFTRLTGESGERPADVSSFFKVEGDGEKGIAWINADFSEQPNALSQAYFQDNFVGTAKFMFNPGWPKPGINTMLPRNPETGKELYLVRMSRSSFIFGNFPEMSANAFFHRFEEFADYFLLQKR